MRKGFTLLEIFFVLGIIGILLSIFLPSFKGVQDESNIARARTELAILQSALEAYYNKNQDYPQDVYAYQDDLIEQTGLINKKYYDPFLPSENVYEYDYYSVPNGKKYYLVISPGMNRDKELQTQESGGNIDLSQGKVLIPADSDDIIITNLRETR